MAAVSPSLSPALAPRCLSQGRLSRQKVGCILPVAWSAPKKILTSTDMLVRVPLLALALITAGSVIRDQRSPLAVLLPSGHTIQVGCSDLSWLRTR